MVSYQDIIQYSPYEELRDVQSDGIKAAIQAIENDGFLALEGACGTGKTLLSLLPVTAYIKDPQTKYNQAIVVTSVKQQQAIFEEEIKEINKKRKQCGEDLVTATTVVGKQDLCPYVKHDSISPTQIQHKCESLREGTRQELRDANQDESVVAQQIQSQMRPARRDTIKRFDSEGTYEYPFDVDTEPEGNACPFYAGYQEARADEMDRSDDYNPRNVVPFDVSELGLVDPYDLVSKSGEAGMCPHSALGELLEYIDVAIANYMHIFDSQTRNFTEALLQDDTLVIVDEAHNLVPRVRDILSDELSVTNSFARGSRQIEELYALLTDSFGEDCRWDSYADLAVESSFLRSEKDVKNAIALLEGLRGEKFKDISTESGRKKVSKAVTDSNTAPVEVVFEKYANVFSTLNTKLTEIIQQELDSTVIDTPQSIGLRDPDSLGADRITQWMQFGNFKPVFEHADSFGAAATTLASFITSELYEEPTVETNAEGLCSFMSRWASADSRRFFQELQIDELEYSYQSSLVSQSWQESYEVKLALKNCYPRDDINNILGEFGAGICMSATLEPLDMYIQETGLDLFDDRPIIRRSYGLQFPQENRQTIGVTSTKFKYSNRGSNRTTDGSPNIVGNDTRKEYAELIVSTVNETPGNVLICMPSYSEAWWAGAVLESESNLSENQILVDKKSSLGETNSLKNEFFKGGKKVLVTGIRGTLTEGVDYEGDKLRAAVICGVPLINTNDDFNSAVETTYDHYFEDGYEFAYTIPAVRKTRQAIGRVIRGMDETGTRIFADERYCPSIENWDSVHKYIPDSVKDELDEVNSTDLPPKLESFWKQQEV